MKVIFVRSPYKILVDEATQVYTKVVVNISDPAGVLPLKTVTLEKQIPDTVNRACWFNISPYIKDEIENIAPSAITPTDEDANMWRNVDVQIYWKVDINDEWNFGGNEFFVAVNGYNNYQGGYNQSITSDVVLLTNPNVNIYRSDNNQYFNLLIDFTTGTYDLIYRYRNLAGTTIENVLVIGSGYPSGIYMYFPISIHFYYSTHICILFRWSNCTGCDVFNFIFYVRRNIKPAIPIDCVRDLLF